MLVEQVKAFKKLDTLVIKPRLLEPIVLMALIELNLPNFYVSSIDLQYLSDEKSACDKVFGYLLRSYNESKFGQMTFNDSNIENLLPFMLIPAKTKGIDTRFLVNKKIENPAQWSDFIDAATE